jgi:simple sugar transport system substrate-binding protein
MNIGHVRLFAAALAAFVIFGTAQAQNKLRFVMVTHGAASDPFWATIKEGGDLAAKEAGVELVYRAPETFDLAKVTELVEAAVAEKPDGMIVSIPNADAVAAPIRSAVNAGIPVITINSGFDVGRSLGALLHVGQSEYEAGRVAGDTMRKLGGTKALCVNHELGNVGLDLRCKGFIDGFAGSVEVMPVDSDPAKAGKAISDRLTEDAEVDVILALNATIAGAPGVAAVKALEGRKVRVGTFDVTEAMLNAVADGDASFAIDQQAFLQGYLPVQYLALLKQRGVIPVSNVSTGPRLITLNEARRRLGRSDAAEGAAEEAVPAPAETPASGG